MDNFDGYIAEIYKEMEQELIASMQRNLGLHLAEEKKVGFKYPQWQAEKLKELKRFQRENERIIGAKVSGLPDAVRDQMIEELNQGSVHELKRYREALKKGYKPAKLMKDSFFKVNDNKVTAMIDALNNDLQRANTAVLRMINDQYRQTIFKAGVFVSNGVYTEEKAVDKAIQKFAAKGLNCIEYRDGRRVNIADYASMAVRTANQRAYMVGEGEFRKEIGETLVIISRHSTSCELCKPFEGKVLIDDVYSGGSQEDGDYMLLSEAMEQGLYHPRCRHGLGTYYPELEEINGYETENNKLNDYGNDVDLLQKNDIISKIVSEEDSDVHYIGKINKEIYSCVTDDIITDEVIITDERIQHIRERHPNDFEQYSKYLVAAIESPDYILESDMPNTAFVLKEITDQEKKVQLILRLVTSNDNADLKNSVITFLAIKEKKWNKYIRNKKILYKKE